MYVCIECGQTFSEPIRWEEDRGEYFGFPAYEGVSGSPCCHGDYTKAFRCNCCDGWITNDYIKTDNDLRYCENCYQRISIGDED